MKNKFLQYFLIALSIIVLSSCLCLVAFADNTSQQKAVLSYNPVQVEQGEVFKTTLFIKEKSNVCSMSVKLVYDKEALTLVSCMQNPNSVVDTVINSSTEGEIIITFANGSNLNSKLNLVDISFKVNDYLASGAYTLLALDGSFDNSLSSLNASGASSAVPFTFNGHKLNIYRAGDFNLDGKVNETDAVYMLRYEVGLKLDFEVTDFNLKIADAYPNGKLGIDDAVSVLRHVAELGDVLGNKAELVFFNQNGSKLKSFLVPVGEVFTMAPVLNDANGLKNGRWMVSNNNGELVEADFTTPVTKNQIYIAKFESDEMTDAMKYFVGKVSSDHLSPNSYVSSNQVLKTLYDIGFGNGYIAKVSWESTNESILNSKGEYSQPAYESSFVMKAKITVYQNGIEESYYVLEIPYKTTGKFKTPAKSEIEAYLKGYIGTEITTDLRLPRKVTNDDIRSSDPYEIRLEWFINKDGVDTHISQIKRGTEPQVVDLVAVLTFNGTPLEGDGRIYFDGITLTEVTEEEVRAYIINEVSKKVSRTVSDGYTFWSDDQIYGSAITWSSGDNSIAVINNNVIKIDQGAINGDSLIVTINVTYGANKNLSLNYEVTIETTNENLVRDVNIDGALYDALLTEFDVNQLSIGVCKETTRVSLDLSDYPDIESLFGLQYCENLRYLNISGLTKIDDLTPISSLSNLEVLIASNCELEQITDTGIALLKNIKRIKVVDLSGNKLSSLSGLLDPDTNYPTILELYLNDNNLTDVSLLSNTPFVQKLELSHNQLTSSAISEVGSCEFLTYLSLADNKLDDISTLSKLSAIKELRLQENQITDVKPLKDLTSVKALYLGDNKLTSVDFLYKLVDLRILYLNNNEIDSLELLSDLTKLNILNISSNKIDSLGILDSIVATAAPSELYAENKVVDLTMLEKLESFTGLTELYADNNQIGFVRKVKNQTNLVKLTLSNNQDVSEADLTETLSTLKSLKTLTLSGKPISDLSFLEEMTSLERLELASCKLPSYVLGKPAQEVDGKLQVLDYKDNIGYIYNLRDSLKYLDISNNPFTTNEEYDFSASTNGMPLNLGNLDQLGDLIAFYADNVDLGKYPSIMSNMSAMKYLSLENSNLSTDLSPLAGKRNYIYVNLSGNDITSVNLSHLSASAKQLTHLYLDTTSNSSTFENSFTGFNDNVLKVLSMRNVVVSSVELLPDMNELEYLDMYGNTITDFAGSSEIYSIARFEAIDYLDIGGNDNIFTKRNLNTLYDAFNSASTVYLYDEHESLGFDSDREALKLKSFTELKPNTSEDFRLQIPAFETPMSITSSTLGYELAWSIEDNDYIEIREGKLAVKSMDLLENIDLTLTSPLDVYENDSVVSYISFELYVAPDAYAIAPRYTASFSVPDGEAIESIEAVFGFPIQLPTPTRTTHTEYYTFSHWIDEQGEIIESGDIYLYEGDATFTAVWKQVYEDYTYIKTRADLEKVSQGSYMLLNDIELQDSPWVPIPSFNGVLQGNGYKIIGMYGSDDTDGYKNGDTFGLFETARGSCKVYNLTFQGCASVVCNSYDYETYYTGLLVGYVLSDCEVYLDNVDIISGSSACVSSTADDVTDEAINTTYSGGLIGYSASSVTLVNCDSSCGVGGVFSNYATLGGLIGYARSATLENCTYSGTISTICCNSITSGYFVGTGSATYTNCSSEGASTSDVG